MRLANGQSCAIPATRGPARRYATFPIRTSQRGIRWVAENAGLCPRIGGQTPFDFGSVLRPEDQKDVFVFLQRASEANDPLGVERVHKRPVGLPVLLLLERQVARVGWTIAANDHKQMLHGLRLPRYSVPLRVTWRGKQFNCSPT